MDLLYRNLEGKIVTVVYKGASANGILHTIRLLDGAKLNVYDSNLQLIDQPNILNILKTPLDYRNKVGNVI